MQTEETIMAEPPPAGMEINARHPVTLGGVEMDLTDLGGVSGLEKRVGFDALLSNGARIVLNNEAEVQAMEAKGMLVFSAPRAGYDVLFSNGRRLPITAEEKPEYERVMDWYRRTQHCYDLLMSNIKLRGV